MDSKIIGVRELHRNFKAIANQALKGRSFTVMRNTKPIFRIEPVTPNKKYTLADLSKISFQGDRNLSKNIDKILYGRK